MIIDIIVILLYDYRYYCDFIDNGGPASGCPYSDMGIPTVL